MKKIVSIIGSTGTIGKQAFNIIKKLHNLFELELLSTNDNYKLLAKQAIKLKPKYVHINNENKYSTLSETLKNLQINVLAGSQNLIDLIKELKSEIIIISSVGFPALFPLIKALEANKTVALANKEAIVVAGSLINKIREKNNSSIIPIDSEHSAIFQCLIGENKNYIKQLILTASGGPFRNLSIKEIKNKKAIDALKHPVWKMGKKITIDSATLMNKGLEVIEAYWLFNIDYKKIKVIIHPQSIIHGIIEFIDGNLKSIMSLPDMRIPIHFALNYPNRISFNYKNNLIKKILKENISLQFFDVDTKKFPCINLAYYSLKKSGNMPCILNASNEIAVNAYLHNKIKFYDIPKIIEKAMEKVTYIKEPNLQNIIETDKETRIFVKNYFKL